MVIWINQRIERAPINFVLAIGWDPADDTANLNHFNQGVPEPYVLFCLRAWLKQYEAQQETDFGNAFFPDKEKDE